MSIDYVPNKVEAKPEMIAAYRQQPLVNRNVAALHDSAGAGSELVAAAVALKGASWVLPPIR
jgi:hypothetical protein